MSKPGEGYRLADPTRSRARASYGQRLPGFCCQSPCQPVGLVVLYVQSQRKIIVLDLYSRNAVDFLPQLRELEVEHLALAARPRQSGPGRNGVPVPASDSDSIR